jgi:hypothetical protein
VFVRLQISVGVKAIDADRRRHVYVWSLPMTSKVFKYAGIVAGIVLIAIGIGSVVTGPGGRGTVHDNLGLEQITGSPT